MSDAPYNTHYVSKDTDRLIFITASVTAFFFISSWLSYGIMNATGDADGTDWRPMGYDKIVAATTHPIFTRFLCRRRTLYESGSDFGSDSEAGCRENIEPEDEDFGGNKIE